MSDVNANINISINSQQALGQLRALQNQISDFNKSVIAGNVAAVQAQKNLTASLSAQVNATRGFSTSITNVESSVSRLNRSIEKNKLSLGQYFRYGVAASGTFGKSMKEHAEIMELAGDRVKRLQTQYVALSQTQNGLTRAMAMRPLQLHNADAAIGIQRQQIFNKLLHDGSTAMVNWGKNTQWAGRQLMVGFTVPLTIFGGVAGKIFMDLEKQIIQFKRVYGDLNTPTSEKTGMVEEVKNLGKEFTKYGIAVNDTIALAAKAAATGAQGADLLAITTEATRLATLGQIDYQQALDATISLQTAFKISAEELAGATDFLNAVENQTVTSLDDITQAIPLVAPVIKGLGGDVKDLAVFMTAMREGGVSANEGANALKSGLASMINPTKAAREQLAKMKIDIDGIAARNKGDIQGFVMEFGKALDTLGKFERQQTLAKVFGKYQFARMGALFSNISKEGSQAQRVIDLTGESAANLAKLAEGELGQLEEAVGVKFTAAVEKLKLAIAPVGEAFLKMATPIIDFATKMAEKFNELPDGMKSLITWGVAIGGVVIPAVVMIVGLFANFLGQMVKMGNTFRMLMAKIRGGGSAFDYLASEELDAMAASASLEGQTHSLTGALNVQRSAVNNLARSYQSYVAGANAAAAALPQGFRAPAGRGPRRMATGGFVAGRGNKDTEPALLTPGEFVVNKKAAQKNGALLMAMNQGALKGYAKGTDEFAHIGSGRTIGLADLARLLASKSDTRNTAAATDMKNLAAVFGNELKARLFGSLGFKTTGSINNRLDKPGDPRSKNYNPVTREEFLADWDSRGIKRWSTSVSRAGLRMKDVEEELTILDNAMRKQIAALERGAVITDKVIEKIYDDAQTALPKNSRVRTGFGGLRNKFSEIRTNIAESAFKAKGVQMVQSGSRMAGMIGGKVIRTSNRWGFHKTSGLTGAELDARGATPKVKEDMTELGHVASKTYSQTISKDDPTGTGLASEKGRNSPHEQAVANAKDDGKAYARTYSQTIASSGRKGRRGASRPQGPPNYQNGQRILPPNMGLPVAGQQTQAQLAAAATTKVVKEQNSLVKGLSAFGKSIGRGNAKMQGGLFALDGLVFAMSMMEGSVGEFAQKIMPAVFGLQGLSMMLPMLMNPMGIAIAAVAAVGIGLWKVNDNVNELRDNSKKMNEAMFNTTKSLNDTAAFYNRTLITKKADAKSMGTNVEDLTKGQEYLKTEGGARMTEGFSMAMKSMGGDMATKQFAAKLGSMVMQGAMSPKEARGVADALETELGIRGLSASIKGRLTSIIGKDGKDIQKHPITVAVKLQAQNEDFMTATKTGMDAIMKMPSIAENATAFGGGESFGAELGDTQGLSGFARNFKAMFDPQWAALITAAHGYGAAVSAVASDGYGTLNAATERYKKLQKEAAEEDNPKRKRELNKELKEQGKALKALEKSMKDYSKGVEETFSNQYSGVQDEMLLGMEESLKSQFEGTPEAAALEAFLGSTKEVGDKTARFMIETTIASGELSPSVVAGFLNNFEDKDSAVATIEMMLEQGGTVDETEKKMLDILSIKDDNLRKKAVLVLETESNVKNGKEGLLGNEDIYAGTPLADIGSKKKEENTDAALAKKRSAEEELANFERQNGWAANVESTNALEIGKAQELLKMQQQGLIAAKERARYEEEFKLAQSGQDYDSQDVERAIEQNEGYKYALEQVTLAQQGVNDAIAAGENKSPEYLAYEAKKAELARKVKEATDEYNRSVEQTTEQMTGLQRLSAEKLYGTPAERAEAITDFIVMKDSLQELSGQELSFKTDGKSLQEIKDTALIYKKLAKLPKKLLKKVDLDTAAASKNADMFRVKWSNLEHTNESITKMLGMNKEQFDNRLRLAGLDWEAFNALPNIQKSLVMAYTTAYFDFRKQYDDATQLAADRAKVGDTAGAHGAVRQADAAYENGQAALDDANDAGQDYDTGSDEDGEKKGGETPSGSNSGGGGGGGEDPVASLKNSIMDKMKLYLNMERIMNRIKKGKDAFTKKVLDNTKYNGSLADKLRDMNLSEALVLEILSKGPKDANKIVEKLGKKGLEEQNRKMLAGMRGEQVSGFVGQTKVAGNQMKAMGKLQRRSGFNQAEIAEIVSDEAQAEVLASLKVGSKAWKEYINKLREARQAAEEFKEEQDPIGYQLEAQTAMFGAVADVIDQAYESQFNAIDRNHRESIKSYEDQIKAKEDEIDAIDREIDAIERLNEADERRIDDLQRNKELISRQIEQLERANEMDQRRIDNLQREDEIRNRLADKIQKELEDLADQEDAIKSAYDDRIKALNDVVALNQHIIDQQKNQLNLAQAFSQGDVYAAAQAAQQMQENQVQYAQDQVRAGLEQGRDNAIDGLRTASGQTRDQAEAQINAIKEQSYQTSLQIRDIEDQIYARNQQMIPLKDQQYQLDMQMRDIQDVVYQREMQIRDIQVSRLQPRKDELTSLNDQLDAENDLVEKEKENVVVGGVKYEQWQATKQQINDAFAQQEALHNLMTTSMLPGVQKYAKTWVQVGKAIEAAYKAQNSGEFNFDLNLPNGEIPSVSNIGLTGMGYEDWQARISQYMAQMQEAAAQNASAGSTVGMYMGGKISKFAAGSIVGSGGMDTVPAMLTPGEFVIRKASVDKYGSAMFEKINQGSFSMPKYSAPASLSTPDAQGQKISTNISAPVYNSYSVNVNASTNASADDIARTVIAKIKTIESSNIRRVNGY